jgi:murein DD-endopeptidase MepM/ murein hydrolase activator NlpD
MFGPRGGHQHNGIDILAPRRTPVLATADGVVAFSGTQRGYGNIVIVNHSASLETAYAHLDERLVEPGQPVRQGQKVGLLGQTGNATAPHVHYEVRKDGRPADPLPYLPLSRLAAASGGVPR